MASFRFQAHAKQLHEGPYFEFVRDYEMLKPSTIEKKNQSNNIAGLPFSGEEAKTQNAVPTNHKIILDFSTVFRSPLPFQSLIIQRVLQNERLKPLDAKSISNIKSL